MIISKFNSELFMSPAINIYCDAFVGGTDKANGIAGQIYIMNLTDESEKSFPGFYLSFVSVEIMKEYLKTIKKGLAENPDFILEINITPFVDGDQEFLKTTRDPSEGIASKTDILSNSVIIPSIGGKASDYHYYDKNGMVWDYDEAKVFFEFN